MNKTADFSEQMRRKIGLQQLYEEGHRGAGIGVAVIDSGLHPDFGTTNVLDEIDFTGENAARHPGNWHGTTVAECVQYVAPDVSIGNLRVVAASGNVQRQTVIAAIDHCIASFPRYRVVNISLSFPPAECPDKCPLCTKVDEAYAKGMYMTVAAGNTGGPMTCPALAHWAHRSMASWSKTEQKYWYSGGMASTARRMWHIHVTGDFAKSYGTSFSAAYASGAAAVHLGRFPGLTADTLRFAIWNVRAELEAEGSVTMDNQRLHRYLLGLQNWSRTPVMFEKRFALFPFLEKF